MRSVIERLRDPAVWRITGASRHALDMEAVAEIELLQDALVAIRALDPATDSTDWFNEWGEADCFRAAQAIAVNALSRVKYDR